MMRALLSYLSSKFLEDKPHQKIDQIYSDLSEEDYQQAHEDARAVADFFFGVVAAFIAGFFLYLGKTYFF